MYYYTNGLCRFVDVLELYWNMCDITREFRCIVKSARSHLMKQDVEHVYGKHILPVASKKGEFESKSKLVV